MFKYFVFRNDEKYTLRIFVTSHHNGLQELRVTHTGWFVLEGSSPRSVQPTFLNGKTLLNMDLARSQEVAIEMTLAPERLPSQIWEINYLAGGSCRQVSFINLLAYEPDDEGAVF